MTDAAFLLQQRGLRWISICPKDAPIGCAVWPGDIVKQDLLLLPTATDAPPRNSMSVARRLLESAFALFHEHGPAARSLPRVAKAAGMIRRHLSYRCPTRTKRLPASADSSVEPALARPLDSAGADTPAMSATAAALLPRVRASLRDAVLGLAVLEPGRQGELKLRAALRQLVELLPYPASVGSASA